MNVSNEALLYVLMRLFIDALLISSFSFNIFIEGVIFILLASSGVEREFIKFFLLLMKYTLFLLR
ncbi:hypothetical protein CR532_05065 (plasmid) [Candidatus Borreliella tachyglossi]|uniref:Uncharacterized protein n=1 Tax=Candidatus Borreliella tachyglossi TaxID=1964448 RepID=A0A2S1LYM7_9SPIR|nr:hypothetical protein [Candidatus Borreliella tachyglossi]AWG43370.1 hypothetical protein CR532_05065 [Candidatus Borreliella tachyglossi]